MRRNYSPRQSRQTPCRKGWLGAPADVSSQSATHVLLTHAFVTTVGRLVVESDAHRNTLLLVRVALHNPELG